MKKNVVMIDFDAGPGWKFVEALNRETGEEWLVKCMVTNKLHKGIENVLRHVLYFSMALSVVCNRKRYNRIIGYQQFMGLYFALICRLLHLKKKMISL